jgi:hypothetical protein
MSLPKKFDGATVLRDKSSCQAWISQHCLQAGLGGEGGFAIPILISKVKMPRLRIPTMPPVYSEIMPPVIPI